MYKKTYTSISIIGLAETTTNAWNNFVHNNAILSGSELR